MGYIDDEIDLTANDMTGIKAAEDFQDDGNTDASENTPETVVTKSTKSDSATAFKDVDRSSDQYEWLKAAVLSNEVISFTCEGEVITLVEHSAKSKPITKIMKPLFFKPVLAEGSIFEKIQFYGYDTFYAVTLNGRKGGSKA